MQRDRAILFRFMVGIGAAALFIWLMSFMIPLPATYETAQASHTMLALLGALVVACAHAMKRTDTHITTGLLFIGSITMMFFHIFMAGLTFTRLIPVEYAISSRPVPIIAVLFVFAVLMLLMSLIQRGVIRVVWSSFTDRIQIALAAVMCLILLIGLLLLSMIPPSLAILVPLQAVLGIAGTVASIITLGCLVSKRPVDEYDLGMATASVFVGLSLLMPVLSETVSNSWIIIITSETSALIFISITTGTAFLINAAVDPRVVRVSTLSLTLFAPLSFAFAHFTDSLFSIGEYAIPVTSILIHIGAGITCIVLAYVFYSRSRALASWYGSPVLFIFVAWAMLEFCIVFLRFLPLPDGRTESIVPYMIGGVVANGSLVFAIRKILRPATEDTLAHVYGLHKIGYVLVVLMVVFGELIQRHLFATIPGSYTSPLGNVLLAVLSTCAFLLLTEFLMLMGAKSGGEISFESVAVAIQSVWLVALALRANFTDWTAGWWAAEFILTAPLLSVLVVLPWLYVTDSARLDDAVGRMSVYSKIAGGEVIRCHNLAAEDLRSISTNVKLSEAELNRVGSAMAHISQANELLRLLIQSSDTEAVPATVQLEPLDIVDIIDSALVMAESEMSGVRTQVQVDVEKGRYVTRANSLLTRLFFSLFRGLFSHVGSGIKIRVYVDSAEDAMFNTRLRLETSTDENHLRRLRNLIKHYMDRLRAQSEEFLIARHLAQLFGGQLDVEIAQKNGHKWVELTLSLPKVPSNEY